MRAWRLASGLAAPLACGFGLAGCSFQAIPAGGANGSGPADAAIDSSAGDAPKDAPAKDGGAMLLCVGTFVNVCVDMPSNSPTLPATINTDTSSLCDKSAVTTPAVKACVIAGSSISLAGGTKVSVTGTRKLILVANGAITISGTLDVASHVGKAGGPAAEQDACTAATPPSGDGGGNGGSFGTAGSNGGNGGGNGIGGIAISAFLTTTLRAGCSGGDARNLGGGPRGRGGGAVLLLAKSVVTIDGVLDASGAGGANGAGILGGGGGGGGGGGSGGMVVIEANSINIPGQCFANGGGGGEAGTSKAGRGGSDSPAPNTAGAGGAGGTDHGGDGGNGAFGTTAALGGSGGAPQIGDTGGGGGGGGGVGIIKLIAPEQEANTSDPTDVSPPAM